jgi:hypothetical protein
MMRKVIAQDNIRLIVVDDASRLADYPTVFLYVALYFSYTAGETGRREIGVRASDRRTNCHPQVLFLHGILQERHIHGACRDGDRRHNRVRIAALYIGRDILIPLALAALLSFLLSPLVTRLERWVGRIAATLLAVTVLFSICSGIGWVLTRQVIDLAHTAARLQGKHPDKAAPA